MKKYYRQEDPKDFPGGFQNRFLTKFLIKPKTVEFGKTWLYNTRII